ncbi:PAS domain S-box-containing protein [Streptomyces sp. DvalAA-14]|uniref:SpoIIE family protein phosphatase n=1 Tax=unclassified Streptomyces TaxID=2593676 RepID=UPI00081B8495|nr:MULTISPECIES: SpoIIE family protein phosphatase [unclassified Streptomyces]MYS19046.1 SpoIIE family protein phosphatase [Streptomyces sp. SID4948]SCD35038.1 PAS domain S-box-containing protein [Streptomyces sp. DvalAA-14]
MAEPRGGGPGSTRVCAAVAVLDTRGTVLGWTRAAQELLGYGAAEVVGRSAARLLVPDGRAGQTARWAARVRMGEPWSEPARVRRSDGEGIEIEAEVSPLSVGGATHWLVAATAGPAEDTGPDRTDPARAAGDRIRSDGIRPDRTPVSAALLARAPIGLSIYDRDARCVWLNAEAERRDNGVRRQRLGRLITEVFPGHEGRALEAVIRGVFDSGEPVIEREYRWIPPGQDEEQVLSSSYFRLDGADGEPLGVCSMATDVGNSRGRQHFLQLSEASKRIGTTLDVMRTAQELADVAVPLLADYATVDLAESVPLGEEPLERLSSADSRIPVFRRAGMASIHEGIPESLWGIGEAVFVPPKSPFTQVLFSGDTHYEPVLDTSPGTWLDQDPDRARAIAATGIHSLVIVPLQARGRVLGEAVFVRTDNPLAFSRDEVLLLEELVGWAALSLDNARRFTRERAASLALQRNLLPQHLSGGGAVEVASRYLPADTHEGVGGDWFDVIPLADDRVGLVVGDVVGHGIGAAAMMGQFRTVVQTLADQDLPPEGLLARLERLIVRLMERGRDEGDRINLSSLVMAGTCLYVVYDPATRCCTMASAGHPPPAVIRPDGRVTFPEVPTGPPIGLGLTPFESVTVELPEGSIIALYTDGLIETRTEDLEHGMRRLAAALSPRPDSLEQMCTDVIATMTPGAVPDARRNLGVVLPGMMRGRWSTHDDIALLLARTRAPDPGQGGA